jgi:hypothetical protein
MLLLIAAWVLFAVVAGMALWPRRAEAGAEAGVEDEGLWGDPTAFGPLCQLPAWSRPIALALVFALISWPFVALTLGAVEANGTTPVGPWAAAASAVFPSALLASAIGGRTVKRGAFVGGLFTFLAALIVAIAFLPLLPGLLGQNILAGCVSFSFGPCGSYAVDSTVLASGMWADLSFVLAPLSEPLPVLILALGVSLWTYLVRHLPEA